MDRIDRLRPWLFPTLGLLLTYFLLGFFGLNLREPMTLSGDHIWLLDMIKDAENRVGVFNYSLGAPLKNNNLAFPLFDGSYKAIIWLFSRFTSDIFLVASLFYILGVATMFGATFWSLTILSIGPLLASVASVAFIVSPYFASRSFGHDLLTLYYSVPMGGALALWLSHGDAVRKIRTPFGICALILVGTSGFYYSFFSAMFLGLSMTGATIRQKSFKPILVCAGIALILLFLLLFSAYDYHIWRLLNGSIISPPRRGSWEAFYNGLLLGNFLQAYTELGLFTGTLKHFQTTIPIVLQGGEGYVPEWPGPFLTTIIMASPIALFSLIPMHDPRYRYVGLSFAFISFGLLFASRFGFGTIFTFLITGGVRAQARIMPFLAFFAIVSVCILVYLPHRPLWQNAIAMIFGALLLTGIYPAPYKVLEKKQTEYLSNTADQTNRSSLAAMLNAKDNHRLTMIFQLPVIAWPEAPAIEKIGPTDMLLPYILDKPRSSTRWSFGLTAEEIKPYQAMTSDDSKIVSNVRRLGFDAILVEKRGYKPDRSSALIKTLISTGACVKYSDEFRALLAICQ